MAEGLGDALRALTGAMTAPDAPAHAQTLMKLQAGMLDIIHKVTGTTGAPAQPQGAPPMAGAPPGGAPPGGAPPGARPPGGGTNLALLQGGGAQGPSAAAKTSISPDVLRQLAAAGAAGTT